MPLKGKHALITGSLRGIGRGIALKLAEQGVKVAINYCRNEVAANDALTKIRGLGSDGFIVQGDAETVVKILHIYPVLRVLEIWQSAAFEYEKANPAVKIDAVNSSCL